MPIKYFAVQLDVIQMFVDRALSAYDEYVRVLDKEYTEEEWDQYGEAEYDEATDILLFYQEIVTRAAFLELNALVEHELRWSAESIRHNHQGPSDEDDKRLTRGQARQVIEREYGIDLQDLLRFEEVETIRKMANAHKHDDGYGEEYEPADVIFERQKSYELDPDEVSNYIRAVREFLNSLPGERSNLGEGPPRVRLSEEGRRVMQAIGKQADF